MKLRKFRFIPAVICSIMATLTSCLGLQCYVCCGCNGESSTACGSFGDTYESFFASSLNTRDGGVAMGCDLEPAFSNANALDELHGEELLLASLTPACSQVIYYDTTFNEDLTIKMCMSLEACEAQKKLIGQSTNIYLGADVGIYADVLTVQCCTSDLCNDLSAPLFAPMIAAEEFPEPKAPPTAPMPTPLVAPPPPPPPFAPLTPPPPPSPPTPFPNAPAPALVSFAENRRPQWKEQAKSLPLFSSLDRTRFLSNNEHLMPDTRSHLLLETAGRRLPFPDLYPALPDFQVMMGITGPPPMLPVINRAQKLTKTLSAYLLAGFILLFLLITP